MDGGIRDTLADHLRSALDVPVLPFVADSVPVPCLVLYPAARYLSRGEESFGSLDWRHTATLLAGRADVRGVWDVLEARILQVVRSGLADVGTIWEDVGNYRLETIAGVDYVAVDVTLRTHQAKSG